MFLHSYIKLLKQEDVTCYNSYSIFKRKPKIATEYKYIVFGMKLKILIHEGFITIEGIG